MLVGESQILINSKRKSKINRLVSGSEFDRPGGALQKLRKELKKTKDYFSSVVAEQGYVNKELQTHNEELNTAYTDITRVLSSLKLPIILIDRDSRIKMITPSVEKRFNINKKHLGKSIFKVNFPLNPDKLKEILLKVINEGKSFRIAVRSDKGYWYSLRLSPFMTTRDNIDGAAMVFVGIDQLKRSLESLKQTQAKIKKKEQYFRSLIEESNDVIALRDRNATILYASPSNTRIFGHKKKNFEGKYWYDFVHPDDRTHAHEQFNKVIDKPDEAILVTYRFLHNDGTWRWIEGSLTNLLDDPNVRAIVVNYRDVTDRKDLEKLKDEFASISSHELRTPLANIRWKLESVLEGDYGPLNENVKKELKKLESENNKLISLVNRLLDVSRVQGKSINGKTEKILVRPMVENVLLGFDKQIESKKIKVTLNIPDNISYKGDSEILKSVTSNLIENAVKYNKYNGQIVIYVRDRVRVMEIEVVDTGIGISDADRNNIFKKFYRTREAAKVMSGVGLGLYSTRLHVSRMGGKIDFKSSPGMGSKFKVLLPRSI